MAGLSVDLPLITKEVIGMNMTKEEFLEEMQKFSGTIIPKDTVVVTSNRDVYEAMKSRGWKGNYHYSDLLPPNRAVIMKKELPKDMKYKYRISNIILYNDKQSDDTRKEG